jgi:hypothetical protein
MESKEYFKVLPVGELGVEICRRTILEALFGEGRDGWPEGGAFHGFSFALMSLEFPCLLQVFTLQTHFLLNSVLQWDT